MDMLQLTCSDTHMHHRVNSTLCCYMQKLTNNFISSNEEKKLAQNSLLHLNQKLPSVGCFPLLPSGVCSASVRVAVTHGWQIGGGRRAP